MDHRILLIFFLLSGELRTVSTTFKTAAFCGDTVALFSETAALFSETAALLHIFDVVQVRQLERYVGAACVVLRHALVERQGTTRHVWVRPPFLSCSSKFSRGISCGRSFIMR